MMMTLVRKLPQSIATAPVTTPSELAIGSSKTYYFIDLKSALKNNPINGATISPVNEVKKLLNADPSQIQPQYQLDCLS